MNGMPDKLTIKAWLPFPSRSSDGSVIPLSVMKEEFERKGYKTRVENGEHQYHAEVTLTDPEEIAKILTPARYGHSATFEIQ